MRHQRNNDTERYDGPRNRDDHGHLVGYPARQPTASHANDAEHCDSAGNAPRHPSGDPTGNASCHPAGDAQHDNVRHEFLNGASDEHHDDGSGPIRLGQ